MRMLYCPLRSPNMASKRLPGKAANGEGPHTDVRVKDRRAHHPPPDPERRRLHPGKIMSCRLAVELRHGYVAWVPTTWFLRSSGHFNTDPAPLEHGCWSDAYSTRSRQPWLLVVDYFRFAPAYEPAGAALAPGSRLVRKAIWPVW